MQVIAAALLVVDALRSCVLKECIVKLHALFKLHLTGYAESSSPNVVVLLIETLHSLLLRLGIDGGCEARPPTPEHPPDCPLLDQLIYDIADNVGASWQVIQLNPLQEVWDVHW